MSGDWTHESLLQDLYYTLWQSETELAICEPSLGEVVPDVLAIRYSYRNPMVRIWEVKASRNDFLSDVRSEKWRNYTKIAHRVYFATPEGIISREDLPPGVGWYVRNDYTWVCKRGSMNFCGEGLSYRMWKSVVFLKYLKFYVPRTVVEAEIAARFGKQSEQKKRARNER